LNSGPLAPQARNINDLRVVLAENQRLVVVRFGRQMDAKTPSRAVWTPSGLQSKEIGAFSLSAGTTAPRALEATENKPLEKSTITA